MSASLANCARHLSLNPPQPSGSRRPSRESTSESADQAAGIFDLYGIDDEASSDAGARDSWQTSGSRRSSVIRQSRIPFGAVGGQGKDEQGTEELVMDNPDSPGSWDGPLNALSGSIDLGTPNGSSTPVRTHSNGNLNGTPNFSGREERWSSLANGTPDISVTDTSPIQPSRDSSGIPVLGPNISPPRSGIPKRTSSLSQNHGSKHVSIASSTHTADSVNSSPSKPLSYPNPNVSRLSPRHANKARFSQGTDNSVTLSLAPSSSTGITDEEGRQSRNGSQASIAGSAQYPGEENDAYYVRSTYARLDTEGVHGDGWDAGVERTRGGPAGKRATVFPANKAGNIGEQEREFLASLDRYGFVNEPHRNRSETRVALIPTAPLLRIPKLPSTSPLAGQPAAAPNTSFSPSSDPGPSPRIPSSPRLDGAEEDKHRRKEDERVGKWAKMMKIRNRDVGGNIAQWEWRKEGQGAKLPHRVYKGIPDRWRMAAWWTLAEEQTARYHGKGKSKRSAEVIGQDYRNTIDLPSTFDVQIDLDVPRTISGHTMFVTRYGAGQRNLWHVLHCFSQVCETCGYVQGMGPIAATLLCYFDPERAYTLLVRLHDVYGMHDIFEPGFPGLLEAFYVQERLIEWLMPDVYQSFQRNMISSSSWGTKWYITLFVNTVPFSQQLRLWDALWLDGRDVMIMTSIALLWAFKDLLAAPNANFESILSLLSSYFVAEDDDALMLWIRKMVNMSGMKVKMNGWRVEWQGLVRDGKSGTALL